MMLVSENDAQVTLFQHLFTELEVIHVPSRAQARKQLKETDWMTVLLDIPQCTHEDFQFFREMRKNTNAPVLLLSSEQTESGSVQEYEQTALRLSEGFSKFLQFLNRPMRVQSAVSQEMIENSVPLGDNVYFDYLNRTVIRNGKLFQLTNIEFRLLLALVQRTEAPLSSQELYELVWQDREEVNINNLYV
ncbi:hypothetical protein skT53_13300 [Effusibacillus dendaii]|uniref:OmpR/PhoB-type domain-containing protein n=1 Tax=Effusibacillus dendaii TaxID=2743772 RepID=A0A7I8D8D6_9BACL|nr:hypothetical protein skT53_13300 [Effusibacillus dendaii]